MWTVVKKWVFSLDLRFPRLKHNGIFLIVAWGMELILVILLVWLAKYPQNPFKYAKFTF
jgi:hypothetical protein